MPEDVELVNLVHDETDCIVTPATLLFVASLIESEFKSAWTQLYGTQLSLVMEYFVGQSWSGGGKNLQLMH